MLSAIGLLDVHLQGLSQFGSEDWLCNMRGSLPKTARFGRLISAPESLLQSHKIMMSLHNDAHTS